jgi:hypothetical protein
MRKIMLAAAAMLTISSAAFAQSTVIVTDPAPTGSVVLPGEVRTYVMEPNVDGYGYTVVNERRVIVEPETHRIIQVLE